MTSEQSYILRVHSGDRNLNYTLSTQREHWNQLTFLDLQSTIRQHFAMDDKRPFGISAIRLYFDHVVIGVITIIRCYITSILHFGPMDVGHFSATCFQQNSGSYLCTKITL